MNKFSGLLVAAVSVAVCIAGLAMVAGMFFEWSECRDAGGKTVRGLFWLECIK